MSYKRERAQYYEQLENGIEEMEATIERLREEIQDLLEMRDALNQLNGSLKKELKGLNGDNLF